MADPPAYSAEVVSEEPNGWVPSVSQRDVFVHDPVQLALALPADAGKRAANLVGRFIDVKRAYVFDEYVANFCMFAMVSNADLTDSARVVAFGDIDLRNVVCRRTRDVAGGDPAFAALGYAAADCSASPAQHAFCIAGMVLALPEPSDSSRVVSTGQQPAPTLKFGMIHAFKSNSTDELDACCRAAALDLAEHAQAAGAIVIVLAHSFVQGHWLPNSGHGLDFVAEHSVEADNVLEQVRERATNIAHVAELYARDDSGRLVVLLAEEDHGQFVGWQRTTPYTTQWPMCNTAFLHNPAFCPALWDKHQWHILSDATRPRASAEETRAADAAVAAYPDLAVVLTDENGTELLHASWHARPTHLIRAHKVRGDTGGSPTYAPTYAATGADARARDALRAALPTLAPLGVGLCTLNAAARAVAEAGVPRKAARAAAARILRGGLEAADGSVYVLVGGRRERKFVLRLPRAPVPVHAPAGVPPGRAEEVAESHAYVPHAEQSAEATARANQLLAELENMTRELRLETQAHLDPGSATGAERNVDATAMPERPAAALERTPDRATMDRGPGLRALGVQLPPVPEEHSAITPETPAAHPQNVRERAAMFQQLITEQTDGAPAQGAEQRPHFRNSHGQTESATSHIRHARSAP